MVSLNKSEDWENECEETVRMIRGLENITYWDERMRLLNLKRGDGGEQGSSLFICERFLQGGDEYNISIVMVARARGGGFESSGSAAERLNLNIRKIPVK